ncbi:hypothetical protein L1887_34129 [Cichorium endivia]|nr:hypothetical protein L1887_34129 [Cichorium endivia]
MEIEDLLSNDMGTDATTCIRLEQVELSPEIVMKGLGNLQRLRVLLLTEKEIGCPRGDWKFDQVNFPNALQFLSWEGYPDRSLPQTFQANNLVGLELPSSRIMQLWESGDKKVLTKLRFLDLSYSKLRTLDLEMTPNLERLDLKGCHNLMKLHVAVGCLARLVYLNLIGCSRFKSFLFIKQLESLELLCLPKLEVTVESLNEFPRYSRDNLPKLLFTCFYLQEKQPPSTGNVLKSIYLNLQPCTKLQSLSGSICGLQHLRHLTFNGCIPEVPNDLDQLQFLEKLNLLSTHIKCLPDSICTLRHLKSLKLKSCLLLEELPKDLGHLVSLEKLNLLSAHIRRLPDSVCMLKHLKSLKLESCGLLEKLPEDLGQLVCLEKLNLLSARIRRLPDSICMLKYLKSLELESCGLLEKLPDDIGQLECLEKLILTKCVSLGDIPNSICKMKRLRKLHLPFCSEVQKLPEELEGLECLEELNIKFTGISHLPQSISSLKGLRIVGSVAVLQSCASATEIETSGTETLCYIHAVNNTGADRRRQFTENYRKRSYDDLEAINTQGDST